MNDLSPDDARPNTRLALEARKGWRCPPDTAIAGYIDGRLVLRERRRIESHISGCQYCRAAVQGVRQVATNEGISTPPWLVTRAAAQLDDIASARPMWQWAAGAAVVVVAVVLAVVLYRPNTPASNSYRPSSTPAIVAKQEISAQPVSPRNATEPSVLRSRRHPGGDEFTPQIFPGVAGHPIEIRWPALTDVSYCEVQLLTKSGDPVWEGQSTTSSVLLPSTLELSRGTYFVVVEAHLSDGRLVKSLPVKLDVTGR